MAFRDLTPSPSSGCAGGLVEPKLSLVLSNHRYTLTMGTEFRPSLELLAAQTQDPSVFQFQHAAYLSGLTKRKVQCIKRSI